MHYAGQNRQKNQKNQFLTRFVQIFQENTFLI